MYADEVLKVLRPKLNDYYYDSLGMWLQSHKTHGIFKKKTRFEIEPTGTTQGYTVRDLHKLEHIIVYDKDSYMSVLSVWTLN